MNLLTRRILVVVLSLIAGLIITEIAIVLPVVDTTREEFGFTFTALTAAGLAYYPLTIIFFALGVGIWLDKFLKAEILPH